MAVTYQRTKLPTGTPSDEKLFNLLDDRVKDAFDQVNQQVQAATPTGMVALLGPAGTRKNLITAGSMQAGAASGNIGALGGDLGGTLPNPNLARGTSFPASPSTNQVFFRTDQSLLYFYNGVGWSPFSGGNLAAITASSGGINTVETSIVSTTLPAGLMRAGTTFAICARGTCVSTVANSSTFIVRCGATGGSGDLEILGGSVTGGTSGATLPFAFDALITIRSAGASAPAPSYGTLIGPTGGVLSASPVVAFFDQFNLLQNVNTTVQNILHFAYVSGAATTTCTFDIATITLVRP